MSEYLKMPIVKAILDINKTRIMTVVFDKTDGKESKVTGIMLNDFGPNDKLYRIYGNILIKTIYPTINIKSFNINKVKQIKALKQTFKP